MKEPCMYLYFRVGGWVRKKEHTPSKRGPKLIRQSPHLAAPSLAKLSLSRKVSWLSIIALSLSRGAKANQQLAVRNVSLTSQLPTFINASCSRCSRVLSSLVSWCLLDLAFGRAAWYASHHDSSFQLTKRASHLTTLNSKQPLDFQKDKTNNLKQEARLLTWWHSLIEEHPRRPRVSPQMTANH